MPNPTRLPVLLPVLLLSLAARHTVDMGDLTPTDRRYVEGVLRRS